MNKLHLLCMPAQDLLERYLWELTEQQNHLDSQEGSPHRSYSEGRGSLLISVGYLIDEQAVEVSVIQALNLSGKGEECLLYTVRS